MRIHTASILLLPTFALASSAPSILENNPSPSPQQFDTSPSDDAPVATQSVASTLSASAPASQITQDPTTLISLLSIHYNKLELRQGIGAAGGVVGPPPTETQMSPSTTYMVRGPNGALTPVPYVQKFVKVPDQWPGPTPGTIGLGTIQGQIGVVKTKSKREVEATGIPGLVGALAGRVPLVKRKGGGGGGKGGGGGGGHVSADAGSGGTGRSSGAGPGGAAGGSKSEMSGTTIPLAGSIIAAFLGLGIAGVL